MTDLTTIPSMRALEDMLQGSDDEQEVTYDVEPGNQRVPNSELSRVTKSGQEEEKSDSNTATSGRDAIWTEEEIPDSDQVLQQTEDDSRTAPEYTLKFAQTITAQDCYMNFGFKDSSSDFADGVTIDIKLPGERMEDVSLTMEALWLHLESPKYWLVVHLPMRVKTGADAGNTAQWDGKKEMLTVRLVVDQEED